MTREPKLKKEKAPPKVKEKKLPKKDQTKLAAASSVKPETKKVQEAKHAPPLGQEAKHARALGQKKRTKTESKRENKEDEVAQNAIRIGGEAAMQLAPPPRAKSPEGGTKGSHPLEQEATPLRVQAAEHSTKLSPKGTHPLGQKVKSRKVKPPFFASSASPTVAPAIQPEIGISETAQKSSDQTLTKVPPAPVHKPVLPTPKSFKESVKKESKLKPEKAAVEKAAEKPAEEHPLNFKKIEEPVAQAAVSQPAVPVQPPVSVPPAPPRPQISINETISVKDLAEKMNLKVGDVLMRLLKMGTRASLNQRLDVDTATLLSAEFGFDAKFVPIYSEEALLKSEEEDGNKMLPRAPIVTIMGHVDHGKTSLLDAIRETHVAEKEAGGITQHIGAYKVQMEKGAIVFLDTPGHEAFTAMRARGAQVTDIVVLVVAADDGVMPQTVEAIDHARAADVPILVAVNKIDLPQSQPERVKQELSQYQLAPEEWGGKTIFVEVSAKKKLNIDKLLEMILLEAELLELKANPKRPAQGVIIEARLDPKKGSVATVLVQKGTLKVGDTFVCGLTSGKVRSLSDDHGHRLIEAAPSTPVEVLGFSETPQLGERFIVVNSEREAREIADRRKDLSRAAATEKKRHISLEMLSAIAKQGNLKEFNLILKADVQGSLEALRDSLEKLAVPEINLRVIHSGVGGITESDVSLAAASDAVILGFAVRPESAAETLAQREEVEIKSYRIIYEVVADIRAAMEGLLEPEEKEVPLGKVEVRETFRTPAGKVAGCMVTQGKVSRNAKVRLVRDSKIIFEGQIASLRRFKEDVREVEQGYECGLSLENFQDFNRGDILEAFVKEKRAKKLE